MYQHMTKKIELYTVPRNSQGSMSVMKSIVKSVKGILGAGKAFKDPYSLWRTSLIQ